MNIVLFQMKLFYVAIDCFLVGSPLCQPSSFFFFLQGKVTAVTLGKKIKK